MGLRFALLTFIILAELALLAVVFIKHPAKLINRLFALLTLLLALWGISNFLIDEPIFRSISYLTVMSDFGIAPILTGLFFLFCIHFPAPTKNFFLKFFASSFIFIAIGLSTLVIFSDGIVQNVVISDRGVLVIKGLYAPLYDFFLVTTILTGILVLFKKLINERGIAKQQLFYVMMGFGTTAIVALVTNVLIPLFIYNLDTRATLTRLGNFSTISFVGFTTYAIIAHRLFDIRIIIRRTVVYSGLLIFALSTYSIIVFIFAQLFGPDGQVFTSRSFVTNLVAALAIAVGFEPLRKWLTQTTDKFLFKGEYDPQSVIQQLAQSLSSVLDLDEALDTMMQLVVKNMRLSHAATVVIRPHLLLSTESKETVPEYDVHRIKQVGYKNASLIALDGNDIVIKYFTQLRQLVVAEELSQAVSTYQGESTETQVLDRLNKLKAAVAIPLAIKDRVIGIVMFGDKLSGDPFLEQDLKLLQIISTDTAGAIEKARLYEEDQLKSEFVSIASHELLTPTAAIEGYLSMILDEKLVKVDEKARDYLTRVYQSARRLSQLVKDLLSVSRIEAGRMVIDRQPTQLDKAIDQVVNDLLFLAKSRAITILWNKPKKPLPPAFIDQEKLIQVLINLVSNGIKYNRAKGTIQITTTAMNKSIAIEVSDTGTGMSKEEMGHLFEKFYRTQSATNAAIQGTGLGLYISKKLIELMNGSITVTSTVGQGSKFTVTVPQAKVGGQRMITGDPQLMSPDQKAIYNTK